MAPFVARLIDTILQVLNLDQKGTEVWQCAEHHAGHCFVVFAQGLDHGCAGHDDETAGCRMGELKVLVIEKHVGMSGANEPEIDVVERRVGDGTGQKPFDVIFRTAVSALSEI